ncbi:nitroreductase/FMN reductase (NADPH) [Anaerovirgula multivorans]|uniref:Nitroreductase/FMN reductase (NADPH) n=1 Tax=Anaerovirgula multivorans TaxID=312168 RepID=A0A239BSN8_9FIRM|nr:oxygen-insensitive NADPH nitroreductase [Anaerovirgula multivorans]SNS10916.1 nitroreductase/FMN reductase (NADPH) [Anaerovirgula multivorans]
MNAMLKLIQSHRSIRKYLKKPIPDELIEELLTSAQWASSSHNVQAYSIIVVKKEDTKRKLAEYCGSQHWVEVCPVFLVFCADFYRLKLTSDMYGTEFKIDEVENLIVGSVDTALAAQNLLLSAESYGLGGVIIGGIRNQPVEVAKLLNLPQLTIPIMGMCLGYPDQDPGQKPRLPQRAVVHQESYNREYIVEDLEKYEAISTKYYIERTNGKITAGWTKQMAEFLSQSRRPQLKEFIMNQGIRLK